MRSKVGRGFAVGGKKTACKYQGLISTTTTTTTAWDDRFNKGSATKSSLSASIMDARVGSFELLRHREQGRACLVLQCVRQLIGQGLGQHDR